MIEKMGSAQKETEINQKLTPKDLIKKKVQASELDSFKFTKSDQSMSSGSGTTPLAEKKSREESENSKFEDQPQDVKQPTTLGISGTNNRVKLDKTQDLITSLKKVLSKPQLKDVCSCLAKFKEAKTSGRDISEPLQKLQETVFLGHKDPRATDEAFKEKRQCL